MLAELAVYVLSPGRRAMRRVGLLGQAVALWSRGRRCRAVWAPHEARCQAAIARAVAILPRRGTVLVLGSGLCRDVPLEALSAAFARVVLVDAVHLLPIRLRARRLSNVTLETRDLTGAVDWLLGRAEGRADPLAAWQADEAVDLVVSANLLSQLPLGLARWIEARPAREAAWGEDFADRAIDWHLADLAGFRCPVCLLTDVASLRVAPDGRVLEEEDLLRGRALPPPEENWEWEVAPRGEESRRFARRHRVHAWADVRPALADVVRT